MTPAEPFEDFGSSPRDETIDCAYYIYPALTAVDEHMDYNRGMRSPGLRLGGLGKSPAGPGPDDTILAPADSPLARPGGGVKRTKSLMQKIKSMVRQKPEENPMPESHGRRTMSMSEPNSGRARPGMPSPGLTSPWGNAPVLEEEREWHEETNGAAYGHRHAPSLDTGMAVRGHAPPMLDTGMADWAEDLQFGMSPGGANSAPSTASRF